ncbi:hypothetical protein GCM10023115_20980 [Pontixanthobacter gangjinensis]|uniref:Uncharacterized protein n=1 Tax=Pontixanthobacter gangjinensis TaxID=1028742 RepID=A0A6I4SQM3_9SPHN|nr:hypothetical protein [Pontixanthobacter gangjinensis]MXO57346.1 hypothetical protein [Pontixanthobacter gangjinensis]
MRAKGKPEKATRRKLKPRILLVLLLLCAAGVAVKAEDGTMAMPSVEHTAFGLKNYPDNAVPFTIALITEFHMAGPYIPPELLEIIVGQIIHSKP